jgi:hypothetical protein
MPHLNEHVEAWIGRTLSDASGHKIGRIDDVYIDDDTRQPEWLAVVPALLATGIYFVPVRGATSSGNGVQVPFPKDRVKAAPSAGADGRLSRMEKGRLYAHYGYSFAEERNRLQRSLDRPGRSGPPAEPDVSPPVDLREVRRPAPRDERPTDQPEASRPPDRRHEAEAEPAVVNGSDRGRWPDDDAIFGLIQDLDQTSGLATSGGPRRR